MENFQKPSKPPEEQPDFFEILDNVIPNEDIQEVELDTFGTRLRFDPKESNRFVLSSPMAQMTTTVEFTPEGTISAINTQRWHGESGAIEKSFLNRFYKDAEIALKNHADLLRIEKTS